MTLDDFISERLENNNFDEIWTSKNVVNPSFVNASKGGGPNSFKMNTPEPMNRNQDEDLIKEDEMIYILKDIIYAFSDLQKARICHRDIRPDNIAIIPIEDLDQFENRKTDFSNSNVGSSYSNNMRGSDVDYNIGGFDIDNQNKLSNRSNYSRRTNPERVGFMSGRGMGPSLHKQLSVERQYGYNFDKSTRGRSTESISSTIIGKIQLKVFNFDASEVLDHHISDKNLEYGIEMKNYPCHNDVYASQYVMDYIEANSNYESHKASPNSLMVKKMWVSGSREGKRYKKRINPFKEDAFALGMTLLQLVRFI